MSELPKDLYKPETDNRNSSRAILMITDNGVEDLEFFYPYYRFIETGFKVDVATPDGAEFKGKQGLGLKESKKVDDVQAESYELLYLPGGKAPAILKNNRRVIELTQKFLALGKPISAICHGPQILAAAHIIEGRKIAAWPEVEEEVRAAGAQYQNKELVVDGPYITARWPADLPVHVRATLEILGSIKAEARKTA